MTSIRGNLRLYKFGTAFLLRVSCLVCAFLGGGGLLWIFAVFFPCVLLVHGLVVSQRVFFNKQTNK